MKQILMLMVIFFPSITMAAASFYKCNKDGVIVYSDQPCSKKAVINKTEDTYIGGEGHKKERSAIEQLKNYNRNILNIGSKSKKRQNNNKANGPCENVSRLKLRNARISDKLMKCHSKSDVKAIYGNADRTVVWSESSHYDTRWTFDLSKDHTLYIYFKDGRVSKWQDRN